MDHTMRTLVTGAAGKIGSAVVAELVARGVPVRAAVRRFDARSEHLTRLGADVVVADFHDAGQIKAAMRGVSRAAFVPPFDPRTSHSASLFLEAARQEQVEGVVALSQWLASSDHPSTLTRQLHDMESMFQAERTIARTIVAPVFFADNYLRLIGFAAQLGLLPSMTGTSRNAPPSNEDIAAVIVAALVDPSGHDGRIWCPTGPALLSTRDMAHHLTSVLGRKVRALPMPMWLFVKAARHQGVYPFELSGFRYWVQDHRMGAFEFCTPTDHVLRATGRSPEPFETIARRYLQRPDARRSVASQLKAFLTFSITPLMRGYDLDRYDRDNGFAASDKARFALQDPNWQTGRRATLGHEAARSPVKEVLA